MLSASASSAWLSAAVFAPAAEDAPGIPPLLSRFAAWFDQSPVPATLVALAVAIVAVALLRMALKFFLVFLLVLMILILGSYLFMGEEETGDVIKDGVYEITDPDAERGEGGEESPEQAPEAVPAQPEEQEAGSDAEQTSPPAGSM